MNENQINIDAIIADRQRVICKSGIYFLIHEKEIVYVGKSKSLLKRLNQHINDPEKVFDSYYLWQMPFHLVDELEIRLIKALNPIYNKAHNFPKPSEDMIKEENIIDISLVLPPKKKVRIPGLKYKNVVVEWIICGLFDVDKPDKYTYIFASTDHEERFKAILMECNREYGFVSNMYTYLRLKIKEGVVYDYRILARHEGKNASAEVSRMAKHLESEGHPIINYRSKIYNEFTEKLKRAKNG